jgi:hypothetical protein
MAKLILDDNQPLTVSRSYIWWKQAVIGAVVGLLYWLLTMAVQHFIIDPLFCHASADIMNCSNSIVISGNVAAVLASIIGLALLVRLRALRPVIIAFASLVLLWGLSGWTDGLGWAEVMIWSIVLYGLSYILFSWFSRYTRTIPVLITIVALLVVGRFVLAL